MQKPSNISAKQCVKPKWDWMQVDCNLKTEFNRRYVMWSLAPSIVLTNPTLDGPDPNVKLYVDTEKSLQFSEELAWNWHKSWNLPNISIRVEIKDVTTGESLLAPKNLYAQLFAVKVIADPHNKNQTAHLVDVGIRGTSKIQMVDGQAYFTAIKFLSTSYNNEGMQIFDVGVKFYLLLLLYINPNDGEQPKILTATLSPPIFVDSRKSARDNQEKRYSSFIEPFMVDNLDKDFIKRENRRKNDNQIKIKNDSEGLFNYLTAPNIRHKVKHPLFLAIKFSLCAKLYFNINLLPKTTPINEMLNILQKKISKDHTSRKSSKNLTKIDDKMFILIIVESSDSFQNKKIQQSIDPLDCNSIGVIYSLDELPPLFENITNMGNLAKAYREEYSQLYLIAKSLINLDNENYKDGSDDSQSNSEMNQSEEEDESPVPTKKLKTNKKPKYESEGEDNDLVDDSDVKAEAQQTFGNILDGIGLSKKKTTLNKLRRAPQSEQNLSNNDADFNPQNSVSPQSQPKQPIVFKPVQSAVPKIQHVPVQQIQQPQQLQKPQLAHQAQLQPQQPQQPQQNMSLDQILLNNMLLSNALNNMGAGGMKMPGLFPQQSQLPASLMGYNNIIGKGLNLGAPHQQQTDLLNLLSSTMNPLSGMAGLGNITAMAGLQNQMSQPGSNAAQLGNSQQNQSGPKLGFTSIQQPVQAPSIQSQQKLAQSNLAMFQQLSMYRDLLNQLMYQNQMGLNMNMIQGIPALNSGLQGLQSLNQGPSQNLRQALPQGVPQGMTQGISQGLAHNGIIQGIANQIGASGQLPNIGLGSDYQNYNFFNQTANQLQQIQQCQSDKKMLDMLRILQQQTGQAGSQQKQPKQEEN